MSGEELAPASDADGEPTVITPALLRAHALPAPDGEHGKEGRGRVFVVGGSQEIPGAVILAAEAALRVGAGKLLVATSEHVAPFVAIAVPEARVIGLRQAQNGELASGACERVQRDAARYDALAIGAGMVDPLAALELLGACVRLSSMPALVIDAAPLADGQALRQALLQAPRDPPRVVLTPHAGEMARLCGLERERVVAQPLPIARSVAAELGVVVVLKGARTYVVAPDGRAFVNLAGNPGLGTSGSGDVLAGMLAGLCARGASVLQAALWSVHLHALAGDALARKVGALGYLAREIPVQVPALLAQLSE